MEKNAEGRKSILEEERKAKAVAQRKQIVDALIAEYDAKQAKEAKRNKAGSDDESSASEEDQVQVVVDADAYLRALEKENRELKRLNFKMKLREQDHAKEIGTLQKKLEKSDNQYKQLYGRLETIFSKTQIKKLEQDSRIVWPDKDLENSSLLYAASSKTYDMLLTKKFPLPSIRTLQNWDAKQRIQNNDAHGDCTLRHWHCKHHAKRALKRKDTCNTTLQNKSLILDHTYVCTE